MRVDDKVFVEQYGKSNTPPQDLRNGLKVSGKHHSNLAGFLAVTYSRASGIILQ